MTTIVVHSSTFTPDEACTCRLAVTFSITSARYDFGAITNTSKVYIKQNGVTTYGGTVRGDTAERYGVLEVAVDAALPVEVGLEGTQSGPVVVTWRKINLLWQLVQ